MRWFTADATRPAAIRESTLGSTNQLSKAVLEQHATTPLSYRVFTYGATVAAVITTRSNRSSFAVSFGFVAEMNRSLS